MDNRDVPFIVFEASMSRMERTIKRLWITIMLLICLLVGSNLAWLYYNEQFEDETTITTQEVEQEADNGTNNFIGGDYNGNTESKNNNDH